MLPCPPAGTHVAVLSTCTVIYNKVSPQHSVTARCTLKALHPVHSPALAGSSVCLGPLTAAWLQSSADWEVVSPLGMPCVPNDPEGEKRHRVMSCHGTLVRRPDVVPANV